MSLAQIHFIGCGHQQHRNCISLCIYSRKANFQRISKISMFGDTEVFFKTLCTLSNEILEMDFDGFCWELYSIFAEQFNKIIAVTETKWGMHYRVMELLQSKKYSKLVAKLQEERLKCHCRLGAVVLTLHQHFLD